MTEIVVAVLTYRRNSTLATLLPRLVEQTQQLGRPARVLVVDNDPDGGARPVVAAVTPTVHYLHEPIPGIAVARNRALDAVDDEDLLVFIDDDERPAPGWLGALVETFEEYGADGVTGRVESEFETELSEWLRAGGFFARQPHRTGDALVAAATNNLLLDMRTVRRLGLRFDQAFGLSGGSDTLFTRQLLACGGRLVWCDEAVVYDVVPADRAQPRWALRRWFRSGNTWSRTSVHLVHGPARLGVRCSAAAAGAGRLLGGLLEALVGLTIARRGRHYPQGARKAARGLGMLAGAVGYVHVEYRRGPATRGAWARLSRS